MILSLQKIIIAYQLYIYIFIIKLCLSEHTQVPLIERRPNVIPRMNRYIHIVMPCNVTDTISWRGHHDRVMQYYIHNAFLSESHK